MMIFNYEKLPTILWILIIGYLIQSILTKETRKIAALELPEITANNSKLILGDLNDFWPQLAKQVEISEQYKTSTQLKHIQSDLQQTLSSIFPNRTIDIGFFGSRITAVGNEKSDFDAFIFIDGALPENPTETMIHQVIYKIADDFYFKARDIWESVQSIVYKRVPIIKMIHIPTQIHVDINFSKPNAPPQDRLISYMFDLQPMARYMVQYLRHRTKILQLEDFLKSNFHTHMVIYFLQMKGLLPPVADLQHNMNLESTKLPKTNINPQNLQKLLLEYFNFYDHFDFNTFVICPYFGTQIARAKFFNYIPKGYKLMFSDWLKPLALQDFMYLNLNSAFEVNLNYLKQLITTKL